MGRDKDPETTYVGTPCRKFGHTRRYRKGNSCADCQELRKNDPDYKAKLRAKAARHRANPDNTIKLRYLKQRYGLTVEDYLAMVEAQEGLCKICRRPPRGRWNRLHVDHDHATLKVRGLLCYACNTILGHAEDRPEVLREAAAYLLAAS